MSTIRSASATGQQEARVRGNQTPRAGRTPRQGPDDERRAPGAPRPTAPSPAFAERLALLGATLDRESGIVHSLELFDVFLAFQELWEQGESASAGQIAACLQKEHGWSPVAAAQLAYTWWVFSGLRVFDRAMEGQDSPTIREPEVYRKAA